MTDRSPAAQAVLDAFLASPPCMDLVQCDRNAIAAALRAAVAHIDVWELDADELLAIADELEAQ